MITIRRASLYEVPTLLLLLQKVVPLMREAGNLQWDETYPNATVFIEDIGQRQLWVAEANISADSQEPGIIAGFAAITTEQYPEYAQVGWDINERAIVVHRLAVDPDFRGFGIATLLMEEAEALAHEAGISILRVDTNALNAAAPKLFLKLGYKLAGEMTLGFRPGMRFVCFEKRLPETTL